MIFYIFSDHFDVLICYTLKNNIYNHLVGDPVVRAENQEVCLSYDLKFEPCGR
jgi:hypothetical protein